MGTNLGINQFNLNGDILRILAL